MRLIWDNISSNTTPNPWADLTLVKALLWPATPTLNCLVTSYRSTGRNYFIVEWKCWKEVEFVPADDLGKQNSTLVSGAKHGIIRVSGHIPENAVSFLDVKMQPFPGSRTQVLFRRRRIRITGGYGHHHVRSRVLEHLPTTGVITTLHSQAYYSRFW